MTDEEMKKYKDYYKKGDAKFDALFEKYEKSGNKVDKDALYDYWWDLTELYSH